MKASAAAAAVVDEMCGEYAAGGLKQTLRVVLSFSFLAVETDAEGLWALQQVWCLDLLEDPPAAGEDVPRRVQFAWIQHHATETSHDALALFSALPPSVEGTPAVPFQQCTAEKLRTELYLDLSSHSARNHQRTASISDQKL